MFVFGQGATAKHGVVSYVTSTYIYAKFKTTEGINIGDTLQIASTKTLCLIVTSKSSISVVCSLINNCVIQKGDAVDAKPSLEVKQNLTDVMDTLVNNAPVLVKENQTVKEKSNIEKITGRVSAASYNTISNYRDNRFRIMSTFSLSAAHIQNSKFSFDTYITYRQNFTSSEQNLPPQASFIRAYSLALRYDAGPK